jgi:hypothetical protein
MLKVGTIDGELIVRVEFGFVCVLGSPRIRANALEDEHAVVNCWAVVVAPHFGLRWRRVVARVCSEDDIPVTVETVDLRGPQICRIVHAWRGLEEQLGLGRVPVSQNIAAQQGDVVVIGVSQVIVITVAEEPAEAISRLMTCRGWLYLRISTNTLENGVGKGSGVVGSGAEGDGHEGADGSE